MNDVLPKNQIFIFDDVISDKLCDEIIKIIDNEALKKDVWRDGNNVECYPINILDLNDKNTSKYIDNEIFKIINTVLNIFRNEYGIICDSDSGYTLRKIVGPTRLHADGILPEDCIENITRQMSVIIALNSDYDGGAFIFPEQGNYKVKLKRGQLIAFPPFWTHPHMVENPLNGTVRYTVNTWLGFNNKK